MILIMGLTALLILTLSYIGQRLHTRWLKRRQARIQQAADALLIRAALEKFDADSEGAGGDRGIT